MPHPTHAIRGCKTECLTALGHLTDVWPALLDIQRSVAELPPDEQRRLKLEIGTNWPPRTTTAMSGIFDVEREGFMFFQGPTPRTAVQADLPSFLSAENFASLVVPLQLKIAGGVGGVALLVVLAVLVLS